MYLARFSYDLLPVDRAMGFTMSTNGMLLWPMPETSPGTRRLVTASARPCCMRQQFGHIEPTHGPGHAMRT
jgi:hypothetical protein